MDNSLKTLKVIDNKGTVVWKECIWGTQMDVVVTSGYAQQPPLWLGNNKNFTFTVHFRGFQRLERLSSFVTLGWLIICNFKFERTENHNFTITTNTSQLVEFLHKTNSEKAILRSKQKGKLRVLCHFWCYLWKSTEKM